MNEDFGHGFRCRIREEAAGRFRLESCPHPPVMLRAPCQRRLWRRFKEHYPYSFASEYSLWLGSPWTSRKELNSLIAATDNAAEPGSEEFYLIIGGGKCGGTTKHGRCLDDEAS